jgi:hypothetical protein
MADDRHQQLIDRDEALNEGDSEKAGQIDGDIATESLLSLSIPAGAGAVGKVLDSAEDVVDAAKLEGKVDDVGVGSGNVGPDNNAVNSNSANSAYHATNGPDETQSILDGINPDFLNPKSRFGKAFYIGDSGKTVTQELSHHGESSTHAIRYTINTDIAKVLDLTDPKVAKEWGYSGGTITDQTINLGDQARESGFNVIKYNSERSSSGVNHAVLDDFDRVLTPETVVPTKD